MFTNTLHSDLDKAVIGMLAFLGTAVFLLFCADKLQRVLTTSSKSPSRVGDSARILAALFVPVSTLVFYLLFANTIVVTCG